MARLGRIEIPRIGFAGLLLMASAMASAQADKPSAAAGSSSETAPDAGQKPQSSEAPATPQPVADNGQWADPYRLAGEPAGSAKALSSLAQVMRLVWTDNPKVKTAEAVVRASGYDITAARAAYLPYVQIQSAVAQQSSNSISTLYVVLPVWNGGLTQASVGIAKAGQRAALAELGQVRLELGQQTLQAYFALLQAQDQLDQWERYVDSLKELLATIERRAQTGVAPQADVETALARLRQAEAGAESSRAQRITARAQLTKLLGTEPEPAQWPGLESLLSDESVASAGNMLEQHPAHLTAIATIEKQKETLKSSKAALWPELSLQHRRQLDGVQFDPSNNATLLVASYQTTNGVQGLFGLRAEQRRLDAAVANLKATDREIGSTIDVDRAQLKAASAQLASQLDAADAMSNLVESFMRQFEAGRKSWLELLNIQREWNDAVLLSVTFKRDYWYANEKLALDSMYWNQLGARLLHDTGNPAVEQAE